MMLPTSTTRPAPSEPASGLQRMLNLLLRMGAGLVAFVLMLAALLLGLVLALGVITWAVLRGRRPAMGLFRSSYRRARNGASAGDPSQVVDVEAREVMEAPEGQRSGVR